MQLSAEQNKTVALVNSLDPRKLDLIINPTEKCNFRCTYCYEDFLIPAMKPEVVESVKRFITLRLPRLIQLKLGFFGGEPLLGLRQVLSICAHSKMMIESHYPKVSFYGHMTTNGYLLSLETAKQLYEVGVSKYQITLDGMGDIHNRTRQRADGKGTFDRIWSNLVNIFQSDLDVQVSVRVHYHPGNVSQIAELLKKVAATFGNDSRFKVLLHPVNHLGGENDHTFTVFSARVQRQIEDKLLNFLPSAATMTSGSLPYICYAAKPTSFLIRADGSLAKCTVALKDDRNRVGRLLPDGRLEIDNEKMRLWMAGYVSRDMQVLKCPLPYLETKAKTA